MDEPAITLEDLSASTGVEPRTLRSWVSEGLLLPPLRSGRGAIYPRSNADRALAIRALKDIHGLTLAKIGRLFLTASDEQIGKWAAEAQRPQGSARDYLRALRKPGTRAPDESDERSALPLIATAYSMAPWPDRSGEDRPPLLPPGAQGFPDLGRIEKLVALLQSLLAAPAPRRAQGTTWTRIEITPDLEIAVRGELTPSERHLFLQLADQLRALLNERTLP